MHTSTHTDTELLALQTRAASLIKNRYPHIDSYRLDADKCPEVIERYEERPAEAPGLSLAGVNSVFAKVFGEARA